MPKIRNDWEADYHDPISDAEEAKQKEWEERQNAEIMAEIELCRLEEENQERWDMLRSAWEREEMLDDQYYGDLQEEDYEYWQDHTER